MKKFRHSLESGGRVDELRLAGVLDEDSELEALCDRLAGETLILQLRDIERVNPGGAEAFWQLVERAEGRGASVRISECSAAMVAQLSERKSSGLEVESFAIPYFCPECDESRTVWASPDEVSGSPSPAPMARCEACDLVMEFDDEPSYFRFLGASLATTRKPTEPSLIRLSEPETAPWVWIAVAVVVAAILTAAFALAG